MSSAADFARSADAFTDLVGRLPADAWEAPGLGVWSVRSLVDHAARAILTVENYLRLDEPSDITVATAEQYYTDALAQFGDDEAVAQRGVEAGVWLGDEPLAHILPVLADVTAQLQTAPANRVVSIGGMGILLSEYLRTRTFELVVHTLDISRATGLPHTLGPDELAAATTLAAGVAVARGRGEDALLALTGRQHLPPGFTVL